MSVKNSKKEQLLRQKLEGLVEQQKKLQEEMDKLWAEQQEEAKPITEKYERKRQEMRLEINKLASEIEILQHAIGEQIAQKSALEDWQSFRAWQEALFKAHGKRIPVV